MDVTFVLEESGVTATVEVPCEADVAAAKEVACTALAVSPASVEMRIGTQVLEGTFRLQDTAFDAGVQVVLARPRLADIKCPAEYSAQGSVTQLSLSRCGTLCLSFHRTDDARIACVGFDTETFDTAFTFVNHECTGSPAISRCMTRCYVAYVDHFLLEVALPGGEVLRKVEGDVHTVFTSGSVVVSLGLGGVSVYDEDLTLLRSLFPGKCWGEAVSDCGGWMITSTWEVEDIRLWDVNTGEAVACVPAPSEFNVALSRSASVFAVGSADGIHLYDWGGAELHKFMGRGYVRGIHFTPCGKYLVAATSLARDAHAECDLHQYDVATMSCVRVIPKSGSLFAISPCSRVVVFRGLDGNTIVTRPLYPRE